MATKLTTAQLNVVKQMTERARYRPEGFFAIGRAHDSLSLCFEGLLMHYIEAMAENRMDAWAKAGHAIIDLFAHEPHGVSRQGGSDRG